MSARALMFQGTGSDVGKSVLVAGFCRIAKRRGISVAPFKPQNMSNNAAACPLGDDGIATGEIGRAQALQARAAGIDPHVDFNPVLLKPQSDRTSQVVVQGKALKAMDARSYFGGRGSLIAPVMDSFARLTRQYDLVLVEGAGSPAEINLRARDIANMGFATHAGVPVCLIGDIDKGGVIASLAGTKAVLTPHDGAHITSFLINKFRGDPSLFEDGVREIENRTGWPCHGVIGWINAMSYLPAEDAVSLDRPIETKGQQLKIRAPMLSRIANFDDADPLRHEPNIDFGWVKPGEAIDRDCDVIVLFGSKSTLGELAFLRAQGWDHDIHAHVRQGGHVLGICGGLQMLGQSVEDPHGVDGASGAGEGLGLLDIHTVMAQEKSVNPVRGHCARTGLPLAGYEIHMGRTTGPDTKRPFAQLESGPDGGISPSGQVEGTYIHGLFSDDAFRQSWLKRFGVTTFAPMRFEARVDSALDEIADALEDAVDCDALLKSAQSTGWQPDGG